MPPDDIYHNITPVCPPSNVPLVQATGPELPIPASPPAEVPEVLWTNELP